MTGLGVMTVIGDIARDVNVHVDVRGPRDLVHAGDTPAQIRMGLGGSASATAAWLAHQGQSVHLIGSRGDDPTGEACLKDLRRFKVEPHLHVETGTPTGTVVVIVDSTGERTMLPDAGANASLPSAWCVNKLRGQHLHVSAYPWFRETSRPAIDAAIDAARLRGMTVSIDLNSHSLVRDHQGSIVNLLDRVDVVLANEDEWTALGDGWTAPPHCHVVVKRGAEGARWTVGDLAGSLPALAVTLVDSTGTGDAFAAGFLSSWVEGASIEESVRAGNEIAAICATRVGPVPEFPA